MLYTRQQAALLCSFNLYLTQDPSILGIKSTGRLGIPAGIVGMMISSAIFSGDVFASDTKQIASPRK